MAIIYIPPVSGGGAVDSVNGQTGVVVLTKSDIGLGNVDNTSDANKPVSSATQTALNAKQDTITDVSARYTSNAASLTIATSKTLITYEDLSFDTNSAYSAGTYTVPSTGKYLIIASFGTTTLNLGGAQFIQIYIDVNGSTVKINKEFGTNVAGVLYQVEAVDFLSLTAGDLVTIHGISSVSTTMNASSFCNVFSIKKIT